MFDGLKEKVGPLPIWAWGGMGAIGFAAFLLLVRRPDRTATSGDNIQGTASPGIGHTAGDLSLLEGEVNDLISKIHQVPVNGGSPEPIGHSAGPEWASWLTGQSTHYLSENQFYVDEFDTTLAKFTSWWGSVPVRTEDWLGLTRQYGYARDTLASRLSNEVDALNEQYKVQSATMSSADAAAFYSQTQDQIARLRAQYSDNIQRWNTVMASFHQVQTA